jgi:guanyl-specific ribonuclease Sa
MRRRLVTVLILLVAAATLWQREAGPPVPSRPGPPAGELRQDRLPGGDSLPAEAWNTLELIQRNGPFPYRQDGTEFRNREGHLPAAGRGFYREYTVPTKGSRDRGARRIVTGGRPPTVWYYTDDHYRTFRPVTPPAVTGGGPRP